MIYVLGSINNDITIELARYPKKGETLTAEKYRMGLGGKGANQAVAVAKLDYRDGENPSVRLIGRVGSDTTGEQLLHTLKEYKVDTRYVKKVNRSTGTAVVVVTPKNNKIVVYGGANLGLMKTDVDEAFEHATNKDTLVCQLEVPLYVVTYALRRARQIGMTTILNPAPAKSPLPDEAYYNVDIIVPNEVETHALTGIKPQDWESQKEAIQAFHNFGVPYVAITLGDKGVALSDGSYILDKIPAQKVTSVDPTGAGDTFVGALALAYPQIGMYSFRDACIFASRAAALAVTKEGSSESIPTASEVYELYCNHIKGSGDTFDEF